MISPSQKTVLESYVLDATANDVESITSMTPDIRSWASSEKTDFSADHLIDAIESLVLNGKLKTYRFSKTTNRYEAATFNRKDIDDLWFSSRPG